MSAWNDFALNFRHKVNNKCFAFRFKQYGIVWSAIADPTTKPKKGCRVIDTAQREVSTYFGQPNVIPIVYLEASF